MIEDHCQRGTLGNLVRKAQLVLKYPEPSDQIAVEDGTGPDIASTTTRSRL